MTIRNWISVSLIIVVVAVMGAGCLGMKAPVTASAPLPALVLDYHRTGGIAGVDDRLIIFDNGAAVISTRSVSREFEVNRSELERLERIFLQAGYTTLQEKYTSPSGGADFMRYSITYQNKTVVTEDTVTPYPLQSVIRELNGIISSARAADTSSGHLPVIRT
jgi:hypothetical protein